MSRQDHWEHVYGSSTTDKLGSEFALVNNTKELHITPGGVEQMYQFCQFRKIANVANQ